MDPIQRLQDEMDDAMMHGDFQKANYYKHLIAQQDELNRMYNERQDQMNMLMTPNPIFNLNLKPGSVFPVDDLNGDIVTWSTGTTANWETESADSFKRRQEEDQKRNLKLFIHFGKLLCELYPNWSMTPDPNDPFKNVTLFHSNGKYRIESAYPDNAVKLWGVEKDQDREDANFRRRNGIPNALRGTPTPETVPTYTFFGWAIGMNDIPNWVTE